MLRSGSGRDRPIGVFDSGVGGLSVWRELARLLPGEGMIYLADQARAPYGERTREEVTQFTHESVAWLLAQGVKLVVVACNTASAAALTSLRRRWPDTPIVGMEPAVKPASQRTRTGHVGVLATPGTLQADRFTSLVARFANGVHVHTVMGVGLVRMVEEGVLDGPDAEARLRAILAPLQEAPIDQLVLGCTHFPFLEAALRQVLGDGVELVNPAPAVARHTRRTLEQAGLLRTAPHPGPWHFFTTGDLARFKHFVHPIVDSAWMASERWITFRKITI
ncbi:MAG TPA: glutamate racemase [Anaerolineae bacterium]|nr:glutamate racemase [Anaerolineae bacterium]HIQ11240.1 glutamate racemase [Caldilineales bacterium]